MEKAWSDPLAVVTSIIVCRPLMILLGDIVCSFKISRSVCLENEWQNWKNNAAGSADAVQQ